MVSALDNVIQKRHDKETCKYNCIKNGRAFNHEPYHCRYFSNDASYNELLAKRTFTKSDYPDEAQPEIEENTEKLLELADLSTIWERLKVEVQLGCSKHEDIIDTASSVAKMFVHTSN